MKAIGVVNVSYHKDVEIYKSVLKDCSEGGARVFELTNQGDFVHEVFGELIEWLLSSFRK